MAPKGGKKAAASAASNHQYSIGDKVLGRIKGFPPWPAKIVDPAQEVYLKKAVLSQKPAKLTTFLVRYYDDGNYAWQKPAELQPLSDADITTFLGGEKKKGALYNAYKVAQNPDKWEQKHAENMEVAKKRDEDKAAGVDELESDSEQVGKKRKRKEPAKKSAGKKANKKAAHSEDKLAEKAPKKLKPTPEEEAEPGFRKCKEWRRELQKGFLSTSLPAEDDMPRFDAIFTEIEAYTDKTDYLEANKLPKVIKRIAVLENIPRDGEFNIQARSARLVDDWSKRFAAGKLGPSSTGAAPEPSAEEKEEVKMAIDGEPTLAGGEAVDTSKMEVDGAATETDVVPPAETAAKEEPSETNDKPAEEPAAAAPAPEPESAGDAVMINGNGEAVQPNGEAPPAQSVA